MGRVVLFVEGEISVSATLVELRFETPRRTSNRRRIMEEFPLIFSANSLGFLCGASGALL